MWQAIMGFISGIFEPAAKLIDDLSTSEEERLQLRNVFVKLQNEVTKKQLDLLSIQMDLEKQLIDAKSSIIQKEAKSGSWITRSWRPITMLVFVGIVVAQALGLIQLEAKFSDQFMALVKIGLGGYVIGRSAEKSIPAIAKVIGNRKEIPFKLP